MRNRTRARWLPLLLLLSLAATAACGGSGGNPAPGPSPVPPTFVEPSNDEWALLGAQLAALALDALQTAIADGFAPAAAARFDTFALRRPATLSDFNASYYCCGSQLLTTSTL